MSGERVGDDVGVQVEHPAQGLAGDHLAGRPGGHHAAVGDGHEMIGHTCGEAELVQNRDHRPPRGGLIIGGGIAGRARAG